MVPNRRELLRTMTALGATGFGVSFAGCGGQQADDSPTETTTDQPMGDSPTEEPTTTAPSGGVVAVASHEVYGDVLVDSDGRTLYMFAKDSDGESVCYDDCANAWPPLTVPSDDAVDADPGVTASLGTTERDDGTLQVTAEGMPLYYFVKDQQPGDAKGMGVINAWFLLRPDGSVLEPAVSMASHETLGKILTDAAGRTLYMFTKDSDGESACYDDCADAWPPLTVDREGAALPAATITASLGTTEREDGNLQVTAESMPLYYFFKDEEPGDAKGQGVKDVWFVLRPDGSVVTSESTPTPTPTSTPTSMPTPTETDSGY